MIQILAAGAVIAGIGYLIHSNNEKEKERTEKEESLWNGGKCPYCGGKWHVRYFYPSGSKGAYQYAAIACHKCKKKATLMYYKPPTTEYEYIDLEKS